MKKILLIVTAFLFLACFSNEKSKDNSKETANRDKSLKRQISIKNAEIDYQNNLIYIVFSDSVIKESEKGNIINENLFSFTPNSISGKAFWAEKNKIVFQVVSMEFNKTYKAEFIAENLNKILEDKIKDRNYNFKVKFEALKVERISLNYKANGKIDTKLSGKIDFNKSFDKDSIIKDLTIKLAKKKIKITETSAENGKLLFETENIELEDGIYDLTLEIGTNNSGLLKTVNYSDELVLNRNFLLQKAYAEEKNDKFKIHLTLSRDINPSQDLKSFVYISDLETYDVKADKNTLIIHGEFQAAKEYQVKLFSGLKSVDNYSLVSNFNRTVTTPDLKPQIEFSNKGIYLSKEKNNTLRFKSRNLSSVYIGIKKVYEQNIDDFIKNNNISSSKSSKQRVYNRQMVQFGTEIYGKKYDLSSNQNRWTTTDIDLSKILDEYDKSGMYLIEISYSKEDITSTISNYPNKNYDINYNSDYYFNDYIYRNSYIIKPLIISDIGLIVKKTNDFIYVFTDSISKAELIKNAEVRIEGDNNRAEIGTSDENGLAKIKWNGSFKYITVKSNNETSFVFANDKNLQNYSLMDNEGLIKPEGIDVFAYTERGVYRPGDEIYISAILREKLKKLPDNIPLNLKFYTPLDKLYTEMINLEGKNGLYSFKLKTETNDPTGNWRVEYSVGEEKIKDTYIKVETVVPPKIKAEIEGKVENNTNYALAIKSDYLFGEPAIGLDSKTKFSIKPSNYIFKKFKNFEFKNNLTTFDEIKSKIFEKELNDNGKAYIDYKLPTFKSAPYKLDIFSSVEIFQKDGRKITENIKTTYDIYDKYVGLEKIEDSYIKLDSELNLATTLVSSEGVELPEEELKFTIYKNEYYWWWDYNSISDFKRNFKKDKNTLLIDDGKVISGENLKYKFNEYGNYYIELSASNGHSAGYFVNTSYWGRDSDSKSASIIELSSDKAEYLPGEQAEIVFESPDSGYALITVEKNNRIIKSFRQKLDSYKTSVNIDITEDMIPNVYINANVIQDMKTLDNDRPVRLRGLKSIKVVEDSNKIDFDISIDDELQANEDFLLELQTKDNKKAYFTIAIVDEGVLGLTKYKTPDPSDYFYGKEKNQITTYDMFDDILGLNLSNADLVLKPGGGIEAKAMRAELSDEFRANQQLGNRDVKRFKILSLYEGPIETSESGYAKIEFTMPDYTGAVRVMAIAVRDDAYTAKERTVPVKTPIVINAGMPRTLSPNDLFYSELNLFFTEEYNGKSEISLEIDGPAKILGENIFNLDKVEKGEKNFTFKIKVENKIGALKAKFKVKTTKHTIEKVIDIAVNSSAPYIYLSSDYILDSEEKFKIDIDTEAVIGTSNAKLTISKLPRYNLDQRVKWLIRYPYGCIEQSISSVFPQLYMDRVMKVNLEDWDKIDKNVNAAINRLQKFQISNGGMSYWQNENYVSEWGSIYALHFLSEAKQAGYFVPKDMIDKLSSYLYEQASQNRERNLTAFYRLYVLAKNKKANISTMNYFMQSQIDIMSNTEKYLLAASYAIIDENAAANDILAKASTSIRIKDDWNINFGSKLRDLSIILETYSLLNKTEKSEKVFQDVVNSLQSDKWYSTQSLAFALIAVSKYSEVKKSEGEIKLKFKPSNSEEWTEISTDKDEAVIDITNLMGKAIEIENESDLTLYLAYQWEGKRGLKSQNKYNFNNKIKLHKNYFTEEGKAIRNLENLKQGDSIWVVYEVFKDYYDKDENLALVQNLASGLEIENVRLDQSEYPQWMRDTYYSINPARYTDIRDDKIMWFFDSTMYSYNQVFAVKLNIVTKGVFYMPETIVEHMYYDYIGDVVRGEQVIIK